VDYLLDNEPVSCITANKARGQNRECSEPWSTHAISRRTLSRMQTVRVRHEVLEPVACVVHGSPHSRPFASEWDTCPAYILMMKIAAPTPPPTKITQPATMSPMAHPGSDVAGFRSVHNRC